jgi:hypothetical protein
MIKEELKCHLCGNITEFYCRDCGEPVCEDCCVPFTLQNQIDYTLCTSCHDGNEARRSLECWREEEKQKAKGEKRKLRREAARKRYWKPENVAKRKERCEAEKRARIELKKKQMEEAMGIVSRMFRGMF